MVHYFNDADFFNYHVDVLCIGFFDGMHKGHVYLINEGKRLGKTTGILSFDGYLKSKILKKKTQQLTSLKDRLELIDEIGLSETFIIPFTDEIMNMSKDEFIQKVLVNLKPNTICVGSDFTFGKYGEGNVDYLKKHFNVHVVDYLNEDNKKISSRDIISLINEGNIEKANSLLGRYYKINGKVVHGLSNGKKYLLPTANLKLDFPYCLPKNGVYATKVHINNKAYFGMTNIGFHPSIDELNNVSIETNIFDFDSDCYNSDMSLEFLFFVRDEKKYNSLNELKEELEKNKVQIQSIISEKGIVL